MRTSAARAPSTSAVQLLVTLGILLVLAGLILPAMRSARIERDVAAARAHLEELRDAVRAFLRDNKVGPCRSQDGRDGSIYWLLSPGEPASKLFAVGDHRRAWIADHLQHNLPGRRPYENWKGPYVRDVRSDPWGGCYILVLYPMFEETDRDCIVASAGPDGRFDSNITSPRDIIAAGDDLVLVVFDKSKDEAAPLFK